MDIEKSIEKKELFHSDGTYMRSRIYRLVYLGGLFFYAFYGKPFEVIEMREIICITLFLALIIWVGHNAFINHFKGNKLLEISTNLSSVENEKIARKTIKRLHWKIKEEKPRYFMATNNNEYNLLDYEIRIICLDNQILFNYRSVGKGGGLKALNGPIENEKYRLIFAEEFQRQKTTNNEK
jgi:hypothetical protein